MSSAQRELHPLDEATSGTEAEAPFALKEQVAQRLAAHRARRNQHSDGSVTPIATASPGKSRSSRIAAAVAERYANSPSYRSFLAAQAETAIREAEAAADVAALSARAVADAQYELLAELDQWTLTPPAPAPAPAPPTARLPITEAPPLTSAVVPVAVNQALTVRLHEDASFSFAQPTAPSTRLYSQAQTAAQVYAQASVDEDEALILDDEIAFRQAPVFDESTGSPIEIPANLIEFPRQLVAPRKARPRLAEGPLREDADQTPATAQLRIFEVEADQISTAPVVESTAPEWSSILLAAHPVSPAVETAEAPFLAELPPQTAPLNLRVMASVVDGCIVTAALLVFIAAFAVTVNKLPGGSAEFAAATHSVPQITPQIAAIAAVSTLGVLTLLYQLLFFTFSEATPGMRYARIGLCTLSDDNPTRSAMRRRIFAVILSACPFGIGFLWALLDDDGLGWHDRISRMYQRSY
jgi:uncharacterized RDD family membrane protein YckC